MFQIERPQNESIKVYEPGSPSREALKNELNRLASSRIRIPCIIGGREVHTETVKTVSMPHEFRHVLADFSWAGVVEMQEAVREAARAKPAWEAMDWSERAAVFLKAADLIAGPYRNLLNAATM